MSLTWVMGDRLREANVLLVQGDPLRQAKDCLETWERYSEVKLFLKLSKIVAVWPVFCTGWVIGASSRAKEIRQLTYI